MANYAYPKNKQINKKVMADTRTSKGLQLKPVAYLLIVAVVAILGGLLYSTLKPEVEHPPQLKVAEDASTFQGYLDFSIDADTDAEFIKITQDDVDSQPSVLPCTTPETLPAGTHIVYSEVDSTVERVLVGQNKAVLDNLLLMIRFSPGESVLGLSEAYHGKPVGYFTSDDASILEAPTDQPVTAFEPFIIANRFAMETCLKNTAGDTVPAQTTPNLLTNAESGWKMMVVKECSDLLADSDRIVDAWRIRSVAEQPAASVDKIADLSKLADECKADGFHRMWVKYKTGEDVSGGTTTTTSTPDPVTTTTPDPDPTPSTASAVTVEPPKAVEGKPAFGKPGTEIKIPITAREDGLLRIQIYNEERELVFQDSLAVEAGVESVYAWDGVGNVGEFNGFQMPGGTYGAIYTFSPADGSAAEVFEGKVIVDGENTPRKVREADQNAGKGLPVFEGEAIFSTDKYRASGNGGQGEINIAFNIKAGERNEKPATVTLNVIPAGTNKPVNIGKVSVERFDRPTIYTWKGNLGDQAGSRQISEGRHEYLFTIDETKSEMSGAFTIGKAQGNQQGGSTSNNTGNNNTGGTPAPSTSTITEGLLALNLNKLSFDISANETVNITATASTESLMTVRVIPKSVFTAQAGGVACNASITDEAFDAVKSDNVYNFSNPGPGRNTQAQQNWNGNDNDGNPVTARDYVVIARAVTANGELDLECKNLAITETVAAAEPDDVLQPEDLIKGFAAFGGSGPNSATFNFEDGDTLTPVITLAERADITVEFGALASHPTCAERIADVPTSEDDEASNAFDFRIPSLSKDNVEALGEVWNGEIVNGVLPEPGTHVLIFTAETAAGLKDVDCWQFTVEDNYDEELLVKVGPSLQNSDEDFEKYNSVSPIDGSMVFQFIASAVSDYEFKILADEDFPKYACSFQGDEPITPEEFDAVKDSDVVFKRDSNPQFSHTGWSPGSWDYRDRDSGAVVPDGDYVLLVRATSEDGAVDVDCNRISISESDVILTLETDHVPTVDPIIGSVQFDTRVAAGSTANVELFAIKKSKLDDFTGSDVSENLVLCTRLATCMNSDEVEVISTNQGQTGPKRSTWGLIEMSDGPVIVAAVARIGSKDHVDYWEGEIERGPMLRPLSDANWSNVTLTNADINPATIDEPVAGYSYETGDNDTNIVVLYNLAIKSDLEIKVRSKSGILLDSKVKDASQGRGSESFVIPYDDMRFGEVVLSIKDKESGQTAFATIEVEKPQVFTYMTVSPAIVDREGALEFNWHLDRSTGTRLVVTHSGSSVPLNENDGAEKTCNSKSCTYVTRTPVLSSKDRTIQWQLIGTEGGFKDEVLGEGEVDYRTYYSLNWINTVKKQFDKEDFDYSFATASLGKCFDADSRAQKCFLRFDGDNDGLQKTINVIEYERRQFPNGDKQWEDSVQFAQENNDCRQGFDCDHVMSGKPPLNPHNYGDNEGLRINTVHWCATGRLADPGPDGVYEKFHYFIKRDGKRERYWGTGCRDITNDDTSKDDLDDDIYYEADFIVVDRIHVDQATYERVR